MHKKVAIGAIDSVFSVFSFRGQYATCGINFNPIDQGGAPPGTSKVGKNTHFRKNRHQIVTIGPIHSGFSVFSFWGQCTTFLTPMSTRFKDGGRPQGTPKFDRKSTIFQNVILNDRYGLDMFGIFRIQFPG